MGELKGHVPDENLAKYRRLRHIAEQLASLGNQVSNMGDLAEANQLWRLNLVYRNKANDLRVTIFDEQEAKTRFKEQLMAAVPSLSEDGAEALFEVAEQHGLNLKEQDELPPWQGDREYLQQQHDKSWTPEKYGGSKG